MSSHRYNHSSVALGENLYVIGGLKYDADESKMTITGTIEVLHVPTEGA